MPRVCTVCASPSREAVEQGLLSGRTITALAAESGLASSSIRRHRDKHLAPALSDALAKRTTIDADRLLSWLIGLHDKTLLGIARTEARHEWGAMRGFVREARLNIELLARLAGILDPMPSTFIDARRQTQVLAALSEDELRALARQAVEGEEAAERVPRVFPAPAIPHGNGDRGVTPARGVGGRGE
jgi:hypothetical protein